MKILVKSAAFKAFASYSEKLCLSVADRMPDFKLKDYFVVSIYEYDKYEFFFE